MVRFEALRSNVLMFVGDDHESVATAFIDGHDVLLVDSLGSVEDARWMRRVLYNLEIIVAQSTFALDAAIASRREQA